MPLPRPNKDETQNEYIIRCTKLQVKESSKSDVAQIKENAFRAWKNRFKLVFNEETQAERDLRWEVESAANALTRAEEIKANPVLFKKALALLSKKRAALNNILPGT